MPNVNTHYGNFQRLDSKSAIIQGAAFSSAVIFSGTVTFSSQIAPPASFLNSTFYNYIKANLTLDSSTECAQYTLWLASTGVLSSAVGQKAWAFDASKSELLPFSVTLPSNYKEGTNVTPYLDWFTTSSTGTTQAVRMLISYMWTNQDSTHSSTATESAITISTTGSTGLVMYTTNFAALTGTGKEVGSVIHGCIARISTGSTDDYSSDFWINDLFFYYQIDGFGSTADVSDK
jgi:hypothetical protein